MQISVNKKRKWHPASERVVKKGFVVLTGLLVTKGAASTKK